MFIDSGETPPPLSAYPKEIQDRVIAILMKGARRKLEREKREAAMKTAASNQ